MNHRAEQHRLSYDDLSVDAVAYDRLVAATPGIDRFCSSSFWTLPAARYLLPPTEPWVLRSPDAYLVFGRSEQPNGARILHPLEAMWALPSPLIGRGPRALAELFVSALTEDQEWEAAIVTGIEEDSESWRMLTSTLARRFTLSRGPVTKRYVSDLSKGADAFLNRRSRGFRTNLAKAARRADKRGLVFETADDGTLDDSFERLMEIERRSWKGRQGVGADTEPMASFYREMHGRLASRDALRLSFAKVDGLDAGYILGGVLGATYRGLQFSFDERFRDLSLGNLLQWREIERLVEDGIASYDLGTEVAYKKRWGDRVFATGSLFVYS